MILINGEKQDTIDYADRGFQYGDGLFETLEIVDGRAIFLDRHLDRLALGCGRLLIPFPKLSLLNQEINLLVQSCPKAVLKIIITRGGDGRGYRQPETINPTRALSIHPYPEYPEAFKSQGIKTRFCDTRLGQNPRLAGLKHLNRLEQVLARAEWQNPDIAEGLMFDSQNNLIEGTMTNLFLVENGRLITPKLDQCGVEGIIRNIIIELATVRQLPVEIERVDKTRILAADEVFLSNSIIGIWPVKDVDDHAFRVGKISQQLSMALNELRTKDLQSA